jgi:hypothetical protein
MDRLEDFFNVNVKRHIFLNSEKKLVDDKGNPIAPEELSEPTLESSLLEAKQSLFVTTQVKIIELLQARLLRDVEKNADAEALYSLSETLRTNISLIDYAGDVYPVD